MHINSIKNKTFVALSVVVFCLTAGLVHAAAQEPAAASAGETIDIRSFKARSGRTLFEAMKEHPLAMLVVVDPNCGACTEVKDSLRALRERVEKNADRLLRGDDSGWKRRGKVFQLCRLAETRC